MHNTKTLVLEKTPHRTIKWYESVVELLKPQSLFS